MHALVGIGILIIIFFGTSLLLDTVLKIPIKYRSIFACFFLALTTSTQTVSLEHTFSWRAFEHMVLSFSPATHIFRCITNKQKCIPKSRSKEETPINKRAAPCTMKYQNWVNNLKGQRGKWYLWTKKKMKKNRTSVVERRQYCEKKDYDACWNLNMKYSFNFFSYLYTRGNEKKEKTKRWKRTTTKRRKNKGRVESKEGTKEEMMRWEK